jgi:hypothetical protein
MAGKLSWKSLLRKRAAACHFKTDADLAPFQLKALLALCVPLRPEVETKMDGRGTRVRPGARNDVIPPPQYCGRVPPKENSTRTM